MGTAAGKARSTIEGGRICPTATMSSRSISGRKGEWEKTTYETRVSLFPEYQINKKIKFVSQK